MTDQQDKELSIELQGTAKIVTFERTKALNALTANMRAQFSEALWNAARDAQVYAVVVRSASDRAFSAGSDVREVLAAADENVASGRKMFADEYLMNWQCECFSKPTVSLIDGLVMGGGVGISLYGTHRVAGPAYQFAMPETRIGLFPDIGVCHVLARMPSSIGMYLGLTGRRVGRSDALKLGLVTHCIDPTNFETITAELADTWPVDTILDRLDEPPGPGDLDPLADVIGRCFSAPTVEEILARLKGVKDDNREWAEEVVADLEQCCPLSLKITHRHIRECSKRSFRENLTVDYRLAVRLLEGSEFREGVRAMLVDKDRNPTWRPARLEDVHSDTLDAHFAPLGEGEDLLLPTRAEMQQLRA